MADEDCRKVAKSLNIQVIVDMSVGKGCRQGMMFRFDLGSSLYLFQINLVSDVVSCNASQ